MPTETTLNERGRAPSDSALATGRARRVLLCAYSRAPRVRGLATPDVRGTGDRRTCWSITRLARRAVRRKPIFSSVARFAASPPTHLSADRVRYKSALRVATPCTVTVCPRVLRSGSCARSVSRSSTTSSTSPTPMSAWWAVCRARAGSVLPPTARCDQPTGPFHRSRLIRCRWWSESALTACASGPCMHAVVAPSSRGVLAGAHQHC